MTRSPRQLGFRTTGRSTLGRLSGVAAATLAVVALAACGDDDDSGSTTTTTEAETTVPDTTEPAPTETAPLELTYDLEEVTETLVGMTIEDAEALAAENDWIIRQVRVDGEDRPMTMDLRYNRINVAVDDGVITEVISGG